MYRAHKRIMYYVSSSERLWETNAASASNERPVGRRLYVDVPLERKELVWRLRKAKLSRLVVTLRTYLKHTYMKHVLIRKVPPTRANTLRMRQVTSELLTAYNYNAKLWRI